MHKQKPFIHPIKGTEYTFILQSDHSYKRKHGTDSHGIIYPDKKEVYWPKSSFTLKWIRHEVFHAYFEECNTGSSKLDADQTEEQCSQIYGFYGPEMTYLAEKILEYYSR